MKDATFSMDRRQFLLCSSACALSAGASASSSEVEPEPLTIGYRSAEEEPRGGTSDASFRLISARSLPSGDRRLARTGVRIRLEGLRGAVDGLDACGVRSAALNVRFRMAEVAHASGTALFSPWSFVAGPLGGHSRPLDFFVPVDGADGLDLSLELDQNVCVADRLHRVLVGRGRRERSARLGLGQDWAQPKLREGEYFVPLRQEVYGKPGALARLDVPTEPCVVFSVRAA